MKNYIELLKDVLNNGEDRADRTGVGTLSLFGTSVKFNLQEGFPIVSTRRISYLAAFGELAAFLNGAVYAHEFRKYGCNYWDKFTLTDHGYLGPIYGAQWVAWPSGGFKVTDQVQYVIDTINSNDYTSRRLVISSWNVSDLHRMALPPCHVLCQFYVSNGVYLDCIVYQRSVDLVIGAPYDFVLYAALSMVIGQLTNTKPRFLTFNFGDTHIYKNHLQEVPELLDAKIYPKPMAYIESLENYKAFTKLSISVLGYKYDKDIKFELNV